MFKKSNAQKEILSFLNFKTYNENVVMSTTVFITEKYFVDRKLNSIAHFPHKAYKSDLIWGFIFQE